MRQCASPYPACCSHLACIARASRRTRRITHCTSMRPRKACRCALCLAQAHAQVDVCRRFGTGRCASCSDVRRAVARRVTTRDDGWSGQRLARRRMPDVPRRSCARSRPSTSPTSAGRWARISSPRRSCGCCDPTRKATPTREATCRSAGGLDDFRTVARIVARWTFYTFPHSQHAAGLVGRGRVRPFQRGSHRAAGWRAARRHPAWRRAQTSARSCARGSIAFRRPYSAPTGGCRCPMCRCW